MTTANYYYVGYSGDIDYEKKSWWDEVRAREPCPRCMIPERNTAPIDVYLDQKPLNQPLCSVVLIAGVIRQDFLEWIGQSLFEENFHLGRVYDDQNELVSGYHSFRPRQCITIRGGPKSTRNVCSNCGRQLYSPLGKWHLLARQIPRTPICGSREGNFIVCEELYRHISSRKWKKVGYVRLPVHEEPLDGYDDLLI